MTSPTLLPPRFPLDYSGEALTNLVTNEPHSLNTSKKRVIAPIDGPYFKDSLVIIDVATQEPLTATQWQPMNIVTLATRKHAGDIVKAAYDNIVILDEGVSSEVLITYQTVGGFYNQSLFTTRRLLEELYKDTRPGYWPKVIDKPEFFEPAPHLESPDGLIGVEFLITEIERLRQVILMGAQLGDDVLMEFIDNRAEYLRNIILSLVGEDSAFHEHVNADYNAHGLTPEQLNLGHVKNYPIATLDEAIAGLLPNRYMVPSLVRAFAERFFANHLEDSNNPHNLTAADVKLSAVNNYPVATLQSLTNPVINEPAYVTNTVLKPWLDDFLATFTQAVTAQITEISGRVSTALTTAQEAKVRTEQDLTGAVTQAQNAAQAATSALGLAQQCNANVASSEQLARDLLRVYIDSYSVLNWVRRVLPQNLTWNDIVFGAGKFVVTAVGTTDKFAYSPDGTTWTLGTFPVVGNWSCVAYGNGKFVAISASSTVALYSTDGITWTQTTLPTLANWADVGYGNGKFVAVAYGAQAVHSADGVTWSIANMPKISNWISVTYGENKFVAVARSSKDVAYSTDGAAWTVAQLPAEREWSGVAYGNGRFHAIASLSYHQATSVNGVDWLASEGVADLPINWKSITYGDGKFLALADGSAKAIMNIDGGTKWSERTLLDSVQWVSCAYGNGKFVGIAKDTTIITMSEPLPAV